MGGQVNKMAAERGHEMYEQELYDDAASVMASTDEVTINIPVPVTSYNYSQVKLSCQLFNQFVFFKKKFLANTRPFWGPLVPLFWISDDVSSGVQSQSGFCLIRFLQRRM